MFRPIGNWSVCCVALPDTWGSKSLGKSKARQSTNAGSQTKNIPPNQHEEVDQTGALALFSPSELGGGACCIWVTGIPGPAPSRGANIFRRSRSPHLCRCFGARIMSQLCLTLLLLPSPVEATEAPNSSDSGMRRAGRTLAVLGPVSLSLSTPYWAEGTKRVGIRRPPFDVCM